MSAKTATRDITGPPAGFLEGFTSLPAEIRHYVFELACAFLVPSSSPTSHPLHDIPTCLSLSLVNKDLNAIARPALYRQVCLSRPSALYTFKETLRVHPERQKLVKNLHIGNLTALPSHWWPLSERCAETPGDSICDTWIASSLDRSRLPDGCDDRQAWCLNRSGAGCREVAIYEALRVAQQSFGVDLLKSLGLSGGRGRRWIEAALLVQAALDLYLVRVQAMEEADPEMASRTGTGTRDSAPCHNSGCGHYPALFITGPPRSLTHPPVDEQPPETPPGALHLRWGQLLRHIVKPGSIGDRFDHPFALERSRYPVTVTLPPRKGQAGYREGAGARYEVDNLEWYMDCTDFLGRMQLQADDYYEIRQGCGTALNGHVIWNGAPGLSLSLADQVISRLTALENLSLTGSMQRVLTNGLLKELGSVRRATIGPPPPWWRSLTTADNCPPLRQAKELRIAGDSLSDADCDFIAKMPKLRKLEWSLGEPATSAEGVVEAIKRLISAPAPTRAGDWLGTVLDVLHLPTLQISGDKVYQDKRSFFWRGRSRITPLVVARIHTSDVDRVLATAPSADVREAWLHGRPVVGQPRRLQLVAKDVEISGEGRPTSDDMHPSWDVMYQEGLDWWLEGAV